MKLGLKILVRDKHINSYLNPLSTLLVLEATWLKEPDSSQRRSLIMLKPGQLAQEYLKPTRWKGLSPFELLRKSVKTATKTWSDLHNGEKETVEQKLEPTARNKSKS